MESGWTDGSPSGRLAKVARHALSPERLVTHVLGPLAIGDHDADRVREAKMRHTWRLMIWVRDGPACFEPEAGPAPWETVVRWIEWLSFIGRVCPGGGGGMMRLGGDV